MLRTLALSTSIVVGAHAALPAAAQTIDFEGTRENVNPLSPPGTGRCSPPNFNTVTIAPGAISSTGTSNLGSFTSTQSHCIVTPPPTDIVDGEFTYTFRAGDSITGTYTGRVDAGGTPGTFLGTENLTITGGTGRFVGASGAITSTGTLMLANGQGMFSGTVDGQIAASAATTSGNFSLATGAPSAAMGDYATAYGAFAIANGERALAVGPFAEATFLEATAIGNMAIASGDSSTALGDRARATATGSSALGHATSATALGASAVGVLANASANFATAVGRFAAASNVSAVAVGDQSISSGVQSAAIGRRASARGDQATALGANAVADLAGSTAIGSGAVTTRANEVALGGGGSSVRIGDIATSTAAQAGPLSVATVDANGTLGRNTTLLSDVAALQSASASALAAIGTLDGRVTTLFDLRDLDRRDFKQGVAAAVAMGQAPFPSAPGRASYVLNGSVFRGEAAVGGSLMYRFDSDTPVAVGVGFSFAGNNNNAFRAGVAGEF